MIGQATFCVQAFVRRGGELIPGEQRIFTSATEAEDVGETISPYVAGVIVYAIGGGAWDDGAVLAKHGDIPPRESPPTRAARVKSAARG